MNSETISVGIDCEEISRFTAASEHLLKKILTEKERSYCLSKPRPEQHIAVRFAAKEAVIKAFAALGETTHFSQIEIQREKNSPPHILLHNKKLSPFSVKLSMSHSGNMALAFVLVARKSTSLFKSSGLNKH